VVVHSVNFSNQYFAIQETHGTQYLGTFPFCQSLNTSKILALQQASSRRKKRRKGAKTKKTSESMID
jgi:hypothetical protein